MNVISRVLASIGRRLHPLFNPHEAWLRDRLETILREQRRDVGLLTKQVGHQQKQLDAVRGDMEVLRNKWGTDMQSVRLVQRGLHSRVRRQMQFSERVLRRAAESTQAWGHERVLQRLEELAERSGPILVGPWTGEVGFELTYWIPFVRWVVGHYNIDPERLVVCSRGGPQSWYRNLGSRYVDVFAVTTELAFRRHTAEQVHKQRTLRAFDRDVLRRVRASAGGSRVSLLHPALMYQLFMPFWKGHAPMAQVLERTRFTPFEPFDAPEVANRLPDRYIAVRFYFSESFPDTPDNRAFASRTLAALASDIDVVVLNPGLKVDDHDDVSVPQSSRIHRLEAVMRPERNLEIQSSVISRAAAFVGTYGGFSYLAPFFGVPSFACYSDRHFYLHHLHMALHAIEQVHGGSLTTLHTGDVPLLAGLTEVRAPATARP